MPSLQSVALAKVQASKAIRHGIWIAQESNVVTEPVGGIGVEPNTSMTITILLRHLPTVDDLNDVYTPPDADVPFAPGIGKDVERIAGELSEICRQHGLETIYYSNNPRGRRTFQLLSPSMCCDSEWVPDARLNNILQPEWAHLNQRDVSRTELYRQWHADPGSVQFEHGENLGDVKIRVESFLEQVSGRGGVVISHTTPMQVMLCLLLGCDVTRLWSFKFDHCAFTLLADRTLLRYNAKCLTDIKFGELRR